MARDSKFGLVKINPLLTWTRRDVWAYIVTHSVPYNPLHDRGYASIGCWPCTRPVDAGQDERAGRWAGHAKTECGLHVDGPQAIAPLVEIKVKSSFGCEEKLVPSLPQMAGGEALGAPRLNQDELTRLSTDH